MNNLVKISTYAKLKGISRMHSNRLFDTGSVNGVFIDGVKFIRISDEEKKQIKNIKK